MSDSTDSSKRSIMGSILPKAKPPQKDPTASMSFLDHLEELRWRILKGVAGVTVGVIIAFIFSDFSIDEFILGPAKPDFFMYQIMPIEPIELTLISRRLPGQFFTYWGTLIIIGLIIGAPLFIYQLYWYRSRFNFSASSKFLMPSITTLISTSILPPLQYGH